MGVLLKAHLYGAFVMTASNAVCGIWALYLWIKRRSTGAAFDIALKVAFAAVYLQVALGAYLFGRGLRPKDATHVLYGITPAVAILVLFSSRTSLETRKAQVYAIACLAFAGMGIRGILTGFGS